MLCGFESKLGVVIQNTNPNKSIGIVSLSLEEWFDSIYRVNLLSSKTDAIRFN